MNPLSDRYSLRFSMDKYGKGHLMLWEAMNGVLVSRHSWAARSGSITKDGVLVNCIGLGKWFLCKAPELPAKEEYDLMRIKELPGFGWKWRLSRTEAGEFTHYLIHMDGGLPGSTGCIVITDSNAIELYSIAVNHMLTCGDIIPVEVVFA